MDSEEELAAPEIARMRAGLRNKTDVEGKGRARCNTRTIQRLVHTLHDGRRAHASPHHQKKERR